MAQPGNATEVDRLLKAGDSIGALLSVLRNVGATPTLYGKPVESVESFREDIHKHLAERLALKLVP